MKLINDFVSTMNLFWYRDFPVSQTYKLNGSRAEWTIHIGICVRACADLMGLFTYFESGQRTDAILKDNKENHIAHIEWEWGEPISAGADEIEKLFISKENTRISVLITYSHQDNHDQNIRYITQYWKSSDFPLIVMLVTFSKQSGRRLFHDLETYLVKNGQAKLLRRQPALPWNAKGTRWES